MPSKKVKDLLYVPITTYISIPKSKLNSLFRSEKRAYLAQLNWQLFQGGDDKSLRKERRWVKAYTLTRFIREHIKGQEADIGDFIHFQGCNPSDVDEWLWQYVEDRFTMIADTMPRSFK